MVHYSNKDTLVSLGDACVDSQGFSGWVMTSGQGGLEELELAWTHKSGWVWPELWVGRESGQVRPVGCDYI